MYLNGRIKRKRPNGTQKHWPRKKFCCRKKSLKKPCLLPNCIYFFLFSCHFWSSYPILNWNFCILVTKSSIHRKTSIFSKYIDFHRFVLLMIREKPHSMKSSKNIDFIEMYRFLSKSIDFHRFLLVIREKPQFKKSIDFDRNR